MHARVTLKGKYSPTSKQVGKMEVHQIFRLTAANNGKIPVSMCVKFNPDFFGIIVVKI